MKGFKGTPGPWIADIRGGCAAIYHANCVDETPGCHSDDSRNIAYSNKGAKFNGMRWEIDSSVEYDFKLMAAAPELLEALQLIMNGDFYMPKESADVAKLAIAKALGEPQ